MRKWCTRRDNGGCVVRTDSLSTWMGGRRCHKQNNGFQNDLICLKCNSPWTKKKQNEMRKNNLFVYVWPDGRQYFKAGRLVHGNQFYPDGIRMRTACLNTTTFSVINSQIKRKNKRDYTQLEMMAQSGVPGGGGENKKK